MTLFGSFRNKRIHWLCRKKLIGKALNLYLDHLKRSAYIMSYKASGQDEDLLILAEEGLKAYLKQLENEAG
jgi:hypothetical protein